MSGREVEPTFHFGFVFQQIPETSTVPVTSGETSRKRAADDESASDEPSASRRRRCSVGTDPTQYVAPSYPSCCVNGFLEHTYIIQNPGYHLTAAMNISPVNMPFFGPHVYSTQNQSQLSPLPGTTPVVHNVSPFAFYFQGPNSYPTYANHLAHWHPAVAPQMVRFPIAPIEQNHRQDMVHLDRHINPPSILFDATVGYSGMRRSTEDIVVNPLPLPPPVAANHPDILHRHPQPALAYVSRYVGWDTMSPSTDSTHIINHAGTNRLSGDHIRSNRVPLRRNGRWEDLRRGNATRMQIDGPVAIPTLSTDWARLHVPRNRMPLAPGMTSEEIPFRTWGASILEIFDHMGPAMNSIRFTPKGLLKSEIDKLKLIRVSDPAQLMEKLCVICQCDFEKREMVRVLPCGHNFHMKCIDKWLKNNRTCPTCRKSAASAERNDGAGSSASATGNRPSSARNSGNGGVGPDSAR